MAEKMTSQAQAEQTSSAKNENSATTPAKDNPQRGEFSASAQETGEYTAEEQQQQPENVGAFKAKGHDEEAPEKSPGYNPLDWGNETNVSDWLVGMFSGRLQDWFIGNLELAGHYVDKALNKVDKYIDRRDERKKLSEQEAIGKSNKDKDKDGKDKNNKDKDGKDKNSKDKDDKSKSEKQQKRNDHKAQKAQDLADKAKKNMANRSYDNSALGKNQQAYDQMTVESLQREADYRKNVAADPGYAKSPEGRKARAELVGDRRALAAMQKETGVNNKIVDGDIKKKTKGQKAVQKARIGLKAAGLAARDQKKKITNKVKQAHQKGVKKLKQKANLKMFSNLKTQMKNIVRKKNRPQSRQQGNSMVPALRQQKGRG